MKQRIKTFEDYNPYDIEEDVNLFLDFIEGELHDVIVGSYWDHEANVANYCVVLVYTPCGGENEEESWKEKGRKSHERIFRWRLA
jgi:hypothetical protein